MESIETRLSGGHPNSLGNTIEVVEDVLADPALIEDLFNCYFSEDEVVRLRVSNAMKRICKANKELVTPFIDRLQDEVAKIDQASAQWTLAQLFAALEPDLSPQQKGRAKEIMKYNLDHHHDWIVLNMTMDCLGRWAENDAALRDWLVPRLQCHSLDKRRSVAKKAARMLDLVGHANNQE